MVIGMMLLADRHDVISQLAIPLSVLVPESLMPMKSEPATTAGAITAAT